MGFSAEDRLLVINCDDFGSSRSANLAIEQAMRSGFATTTSLMVPCPWAHTAVMSCKDLDIGIHLTLTSEYPAYRWGPLTDGPSLRDEDGYLPRTIEEVRVKADLLDVEHECRAQIEQARQWGIEPTHLDSHMDVLQLDRHFFDVYMRLAAEYALPVRLRATHFEWPFSYVTHETLDRHEIVTPDRLVAPPWGEPARKILLELLAKLPPGVTEFSVHPVCDSDELRTYDQESAEVRAADARLLQDKDILKLVAESGAKLLGYAPLRNLMRGQTHERGQPAGAGLTNRARDFGNRNGAP
jgi:predicted glycoside hydrolase/deacetylase ChbG (UPF0249 family)